MIIYEKCKICDNSDFSEYLKLKDYFFSLEEFSILKCNVCGFKITFPFPSSDKIGGYYKTANYVSHSDTQSGLFFKIYHFVKKYNLSKKYNLIKKYIPNGRILDYGCGTGDFSGLLKMKGWESYGVEQDNETRNYASKKHNIKIFEPNAASLFKEDFFDVITMWHVLEHVENLNEKINELKKNLSNNGIIVIAVPNSDSFDAKYYGKYWAGYDVPRHLYHFNIKTLSGLLEKNGFEIIAKKNMFFDSFYVSFLSEKYLKNKWGIFRGFFIGLFSNFYTIKKNVFASSFILVVKKKGLF